MAGISYFLKIEGIKGDCADAKHKDEIDVLSFSWGMSHEGVRPATAGGGLASGHPNANAFVVVKHHDSASPVLFQVAAMGTHIKEAQLTARALGAKGVTEFMQIKLTDVLVTDYSTASSPPEGIPTEQIKLTFQKLWLGHAGPKPDGSPGPSGGLGFDFSKSQKF
jgi:type VI secretion system secreted protein Hcp